MDLIHLLLQIAQRRLYLIRPGSTEALVEVADRIFCEETLKRLARLDSNAHWSQEFLRELTVACHGDAGWEPVISTRGTREDELAELFARCVTSKDK